MSLDHSNKYPDAFELKWEREIKELNTKFLLFIHKKTGAEVLVGENNDENKTFGISFDTPQNNSTGIAHILEHSILCGSEKFPVKEPFVILLQNSLNTFLNAFTFGDKTMYPVASMNEQDFYNLALVYLDSVFYPRITENIFKQEGWHYELEEGKDLPEYKGVVFNEMKGAYSDAQRHIAYGVERTLFKDTIFSHDSGGYPFDILHLTYEEFKSFHKKYYHPSNAKVFFYGDGDTIKHLEFVQEYLDKFNKQEINFPKEYKSQEYFDEVIEKEYLYPISKDEESLDKKYIFTVNWLLKEFDTVEERIAMQVLAYALINSDAAILKKVLIESGLGDDIAGVGYDEYRQNIFSIGLKNIKKEDAGKVKELILNTLEELSKNGVNKDLLESALNIVDFAKREISDSSYYPDGLMIYMNSLIKWQYGGDPLEVLTYEDELNSLKKRLENDDGYFRSLIEKHFVNNKNRADILFTPDPEYNDRNAEKEKKLLMEYNASLSEDERKNLIEETKELIEYQHKPDKPEDIKKIPRLSVEDMKKESEEIESNLEDFGGNTLLYNEVNTNGVIYTNLGFDISDIEFKYLQYLPLLGECILRSGTENKPYDTLITEIQKVSGGLSCDLHISNKLNDTDKLNTYLFLSGKSVESGYERFLELTLESIYKLKIEKKRLKEIVKEDINQIEESIIGEGHIYTLDRVKSKISKSSYLAEKIEGISYLFFLRDLVKKIETDFESIKKILLELRDKVFTKQNLIINLTTEKKLLDISKRSLSKFKDGLASMDSQKSNVLHEFTIENAERLEYLTVPADVNYVGQGFLFEDIGYEYTGSLNTISILMNRDYLWNEIRVKGGAYGAFCRMDTIDKSIAFATYRDPNTQNSLNVYQNSYKYLLETDFSKDQIDGAIIAAIGRIDTYKKPQEKGGQAMEWYLKGVSKEYRQQKRNEHLSTKLEDIRAFGEAMKNYLENLDQSSSNVAIIGGDAGYNKLGDNIKEKIKKVKVL